MNLFRREKRQFFRHPVSVPIQLKMEDRPDTFVSESKDISMGGLSFIWPNKLPKKSLITLMIPVKEKVFEVTGRVAYCKNYKKSTEFRTGVNFADAPNAFKAKLAEELLQIIEYQRSASRELGRVVSEEEAAKRWVDKYAKSFSDRIDSGT